SHELRTPLQAILGWSKVLRREKTASDTVLQGVDVIERNAGAQKRLIEEMLEMNRILSGKLRLKVRPLDLREVVEAALESMRPAADAKGVALECELDPLAGPFSGDAHRLQQVVWNLLANAIKFTPPGGSVRVRLARVESRIEIEVEDTGQGIRPEFLPHVFERFRQEDASTTRAQSGLGLGLAIVRHLVELHGGQVSATSEGEDQGSSFLIRLPASPLVAYSGAEADDEGGGHSDLAVPAPPGALAMLRVLLVEDDADSRDLMR